MANTSSYEIVTANASDDPTDNTTYVFAPTAILKTFSLGGNSDGDTIAINALSTDFKVRFKKNEMILTGLKDSPSAGVIVKVQLDTTDGGVGKLTFLDGTIDVAFEPTTPGSTKGSWDFGGLENVRKLNLSKLNGTYDIDGTKTYYQADAAARVELNSPTHELTTDLDNIVGDASAEVIFGNLTDTDGNQYGGDLEYADAANGGDGIDTMVLYTWGDATVDTTDYEFANIENLVIQARNGQDANTDIDLAGMDGLESIEFKNFIGGESDLSIESAPGVVIVENFQNEDNNVNIQFAESVTDAEITLTDVMANAIWVDEVANVEQITLNLEGVDDNDSNAWFGVDGDENSVLESVTVNVTEDSHVFLDFNEGHHANLTSITINADADFKGGIDFAEGHDANDDTIDVTTSLTINGAGDVNINGTWEDDVLNVVYTGSGSLILGSEDEEWEPVDGSFTAANATGDATVYLDLNEDIESFTFVGSKGQNIVHIDDNSAHDSVLDGDGNVDANVTVSISAGSGTEDVLVIEDDNDVAEKVADIYSGFEILRVDNFGEDQSYDLTHLGAGFKAVELVYSEDFATDVNIDVELTAAVADDISIFESGEDAVFNSLNLSLDDDLAADDTMKVSFVKSDAYTNDNMDAEQDSAIYGEDLTIDGVEQITLNSTGLVEDANGNEQWNAIGEFYADELRTLTITGDVNFDIDENLEASKLYLIDATGFTGDDLEIEDIEVGSSLEYRGSATANQRISLDAYGDDVLVNTGSGDDSIDVYVAAPSFEDDVTINAGSGDNNIYVDDNADNIDVIITAGNGDDDVNIYDAHDVTITLGDGNNTVDIYDAEGTVNVTTGSGDDSIWIQSGDEVTVVAGAGDDRVGFDLDTNINNAYVTLGAGEDLLSLQYVIDNYYDDVGEDTEAWVDSNYVVEVSDFAVAEDVIGLDIDINGNIYDIVFREADIADGDYNVGASTDVDDLVVLEFNFEADHNDVDFADKYADGDLDGFDLLESLGYDLGVGSGTISVDNGGDKAIGYIVAYNGGDAYLFAYADEDGNGTVEGDEIGLIGVFDDIDVGGFSASNFVSNNGL